jgi:hypothetical protein
MSIPRQLVKSFETIRNCKLVVTKVTSDDNLKEFGKAMNNAIPDTTNQISHMIYKFMRGMYLSDKQKFIDHINSMRHYEAMILWADYDDILSYFELSGVVFLGWNKTVNKYQVSKIDLTKKNTTSQRSTSKSPNPSELPIPTFVVKTDTVKVLPDPPLLVSKPPPNPELLVQNVEQNDDYDILYNRIAKLQQSLEQNNTAAPVYHTEQDV